MRLPFDFPFIKHLSQSKMELLTSKETLSGQALASLLILLAILFEDNETLCPEEKTQK